MTLETQKMRYTFWVDNGKIDEDNHQTSLAGNQNHEQGIWFGSKQNQSSKHICKKSK